MLLSWYCIGHSKRITQITAPKIVQADVLCGLLSLAEHKRRAFEECAGRYCP